MKRVFAILFAVALIAALSVVSFAVNTHTITIDNAVNGETYTAYKIFDVTYSGNNATPGTDPGAPAPDPTMLHTAYSYTISDSSSWFTFLTSGLTADAAGVFTNSTYGLTFTPTDTDPHTYVVGKTATGEYDSTKAAALAAAINAELDRAEAAAAATPSVPNPYTEAGHAVAANGTATIDVNPDAAGYYFVTTTLGSLCSLDTTEPAAKIREKNTTSSVTKQVKEDEFDNGNTAWGDKDDAKYGETVEYKTTVIIGAHQKNVVLEDRMYNGLKLCAASDITVKVGGVDLASTNYTLTRNGDQSFTIEFNSAWTEALPANTTVVVEYTAEVLTTAVLDVPTTAALTNGNDNETWLTYGDHQETAHDWTRTYVWSFPIFKYTGTNTPLADANFSIYPYGNNTALQFVQVSAGDASNPTVYRLAIASDAPADPSDPDPRVTELITPASGLITIQGVDSDKFTVRENAAPAGYNKLADDITVEIKAIADATAQGDDDTMQATITKTIEKDGSTTSQIGVLNNTGTELPSTGGIGTTIFYVVGGLLVVAAAVLLFVRKKAGKE